ncbi:hypothetical protein DXG01_014079 [Tephrocybe rancida]|nr:hypothetical protein DXG01_014079 [Tephrocybe rancida]
MKGHPKPSCHSLSRTLHSSDVKVCAAEKSPSTSPSDTPTPTMEIDDLINLTQNLILTPPPPGPAAVDVKILDVVTSKEDLQRSSSQVLGAITHSTVMMAFNGSDTWLELSHLIAKELQPATRA